MIVIFYDAANHLNGYLFFQSLLLKRSKNHIKTRLIITVIMIVFLNN